MATIRETHHSPDNQSENIKFPQSPHYNAPVSHHSPVNGHNPQCTVLISPESLHNDRLAKPRQERRFQSLIQTSEGLARTRRALISFVFLSRFILDIMVYMVWYCSWSHNYLYGPFHRWSACTVQPVSDGDNIFLPWLCWENVGGDKVVLWHKTNRWCCLWSSFITNNF